MSNVITLIATKFTNLSRDKDESYGFRIYDNYGSAYCNLLTYQQARCSDEELLQYVLEFSNPEIEVMIDYARDNGIMVNNTFYEPEELKGMI